MEDKCRTDLDETVKYYDEHAMEFIDSTIHVDVSELYKPFEERINPGCRILDIGCGSGRDSKYFADKGYDVVAIDPSNAMCEQTKKLVKIPVYQMRAEDMRFSNEFDAVWACASLLHILQDKQEMVMRRIATALRECGILYASWKYGSQDRVDKGRMFSDFNEKMLCDIVKEIPAFEVTEMWITQDARKERRSQRWLNALIKKTTCSVLLLFVLLRSLFQL